MISKNNKQLTVQVLETHRDNIINSFVLPVDDSACILDYFARLVSAFWCVKKLDELIHKYLNFAFNLTFNYFKFIFDVFDVMEWRT